jgi:hypothetical protein
MKFLRRSLPAIFAFAFFACSAQDPSLYSFKKDDTVLRKSLYDVSVRKETSLINSLGKQYQSDYKKIYADRFKEISALWQSTRPVTEPAIYKYLQSIVDRIVSANPDLKGTDARIVFTRDWWPNAFSLGDGSIAINAGLLIFMDNEAELAFAISHEIGHYVLNHGDDRIKKYIEKLNNQDVQKELKRLSKEEFLVNQQAEKLLKNLLFDSRRHAREDEAEADRFAFEHLKNTGYDCMAIGTMLSSLDRVDDSAIFKPLILENIFSFSEYPFRKKWVDKESAIFSELSDDETSLTKKERDSLKTHPDCAQRIVLLQDSLKYHPGKKFLVNEKMFNGLKKDFFLEMTEECYDRRSFSRNLYYSLLLLQSGQDTSFAIYSVVRCLNRIYLEQEAHNLDGSIDQEDKKYPADYNLLLRMLNRLKLDELATINYEFCKNHYEQMREYPGFRDELKKIKKPKN